MKSFTLRTGAWYGDKEQTFELPDDATFDILAPNDAPPITNSELIEKISRPFGQSLHESANGKSKILIVTDDLGRPTPSHEVIPHILKILEQSGVKKEHISYLIATGSHRQLTKEDLEKKLGADIVRDFPVESHDAFNSRMVDLGPTKKGFPCIANEKAAKADLIIGIGCVLPHSCHGFGGGAKLFLPGVAGMKSIIAMHGFTPKRGRGKNQIRSTDMRTAAEDFTDKLPPVFLINVVVNTERKICGLFAGSHREVFSAASDLARSVYETPIDEERMKQYNVVIVNAYPLDADPVQSDKVKWIRNIFGHALPVIIDECSDKTDYHGWKEFKKRNRFINRLVKAGKYLIKKDYSVFSKFLIRIFLFIIKNILFFMLRIKQTDYKYFTSQQKAQTSFSDGPKKSEPLIENADFWFISKNLSSERFMRKFSSGYLFSDWILFIKELNRLYPQARIAILPLAPLQMLVNKFKQ